MKTIKYILFAEVSILFNLLFQYLSSLMYAGFGTLYIAMFSGTLAGLIVKYILDKKFIFYYECKDKKSDARKFLLYSYMGLFTTAIFWGIEIAFETFSQNPNAKYVGAMIGLSIGYVIKYFLDKRFVFFDNGATS